MNMKYNDEKINECVGFVSLNGLYPQKGGATVREFCDKMNIDFKTYQAWMRKSVFSNEIKKAQETFKATFEAGVVRSLIESAKGYEYDEVKTEMVANAHGQPVISKKVSTKKKVAPNVGAAIFLLTNIEPTKWQNSQHTDITSGGEKLDTKFIIYDPKDKDDAAK